MEKIRIETEKENRKIKRLENKAKIEHNKTKKLKVLKPKKKINTKKYIGSPKEEAKTISLVKYIIEEEKAETFIPTLHSTPKKVNILSNILIPQEPKKQIHVRNIFKDDEIASDPREELKTKPMNNPFLNQLVKTKLCFFFVHTI